MLNPEKYIKFRLSSKYRKLKKKIVYTAFLIVTIISIVIFAITSYYEKYNNKNSVQRNLLGSNYPKDAFEPKISGWVVFHIIGVFYMFVAIAIVCDEFFVPCIEVLVERLKMSPDTAGATFMAAGGSAPELFTSFIGTFISKDDVGFGTIVGSAVFNVLFVIGCCAVFTAGDLALTWYPFARDSMYYCTSLIVLAMFFGVATKDFIWWYESLILLCMYGGYVFIMVKNEKIHNLLVSNSKNNEGDKKKNDEELQQTKQGTKELNNDNRKEIAYNRRISISQLRSTKPLSFTVSIFDLMTNDASLNDIAGIHMVSRIKGDVRDTFRQVDVNGDGEISIEEFGAVLKRLGRGVTDKEIEQSFNEVDLDKNGIIDFEEFQKWYLSSTWKMKQDIEKIFIRFDKDDSGSIDVSELYELLKAVNGEPPTVNEVEDARKLLDTNNDGQISWEEFNSWYEKSVFFQEKRKRANTIKKEMESIEEEEEGIDLKIPEGLTSRMFYFMLLPIIAPLYFTVPNVRKEKWKNWYFLGLVNSIIWLGIYSFFMVWWATVFGEVTGIPSAVMGLTILAAGTSVPDLLTSIIVAKHGEADMAVSSSIGSNIFDVLIGLPLPWLSYAIVQYGLGNHPYVEVGADNLFFSILILFGMILSVLLIIKYNKWRMTHKLGYSMFVLYVLFVIQDLLRSYKVF